MKLNLIVFIGLQASGKTTYYESHFADRGYVHINLDSLKTRRREKESFVDALERGADIVIDNTNPTKKDRDRYIPLAKEYGYTVTGYFFQSRLKDCLERNAKRSRVVPAKGLARCSRILEMPSLAEGFDEIYFVKIVNGGFDESPWKEEE